VTQRLAVAAWLVLSGLAGGPRNASAQDEQLPPPGKGTLRQDEVAVLLDAGAVHFRVMPLEESILRLLAPDSYASLHALREAYQGEMRDAAAQYGLTEPVGFLVTVFGLEPLAQFDPEQLTIISRNRLFRPLRILPITPLWNQHRISQRETAAAVYVFETGIALLEPFTVEYAGVRSDQWRQSLRRIERERARIGRRDSRRRPSARPASTYRRRVAAPGTQQSARAVLAGRRNPSRPRPGAKLRRRDHGERWLSVCGPLRVESLSYTPHWQPD
jgi:hypothetical protein